MIEIVNSHHNVLSAWANFRSRLSRPPRLITLDHHTDTSRPFQRKILDVYGNKKTKLDEIKFNDIQRSYLEKLIFNDPTSVAKAIKDLNNDEHIITALKTDIISSAFVLAHNAANTDFETYQVHRVICRTIGELKTQGRSQLDHDSVLESELLRKTVIEFDQITNLKGEAALLDDCFILDIDLDYFNTFKSVEPKDITYFQILAQKAGLITIATEPEYVASCALDSSVTSDYLLEKILKHLSEAGIT